jgi:hypothetical protein
MTDLKDRARAASLYGLAPSEILGTIDAGRMGRDRGDTKGCFEGRGGACGHILRALRLSTCGLRMVI